MAKIMKFKERARLSILKWKVKKTLRGYNKEFREIMNVNGVKTDYKFSLFLVYLIFQITNRHTKPTKVFRELDEKGVVASYVKLSNTMIKNDDTENVTTKEAADEFANVIIKFIGEKKTDLNKAKLKDLIFHVIKLFKLTENADQFEWSAIKNIADKYEDKINTAIGITKTIGSVHNLLIESFPGESNDLIVIINNLIRKLTK